MLFDETFTTRTPPEEALAFTGDFRNLPRWDPSIESVEKRTEGEIGPGTRFRVRLRFLGRSTEMDYTVRQLAPRQIVLVGRANGVTATDSVLVTPGENGGARVRWVADIRFPFPISLADPLLRLLFRGTVDEAMANLKALLDGREERVSRARAAS